jgi:lipoprotein-releasing system permease protein
LIRGELYTAWRFLAGRAREGGRYLRAAAAGIALSLIPIVVTLIVADGMIQGIMNRYLELGYGHLQIYNYNDENALDPGLIPDLPDLGLIGFWRERSGTGLVIGPDGRSGTTIRATDPSFWTNEGSARYLQLVEGSTSIEGPGDTGMDTVLLGQELAAEIGAKPGDIIYIMCLRISSNGQNIPRTMPFELAGIVASGYRELDAAWCLISYHAGLDLLSPELSGSYVIAKLQDPFNEAIPAAGAIREALGPGFGVYPWQTLMASRYGSYQATRQMLLFIMALIVAVAAINVSSSTAMLVIERQKDIAILKAIGSEPAAVRRIFLFASLLTGIVGALVGLSLGLLIGINVNTLVHGLETVLTFFSGLFSGAAVKILDPGFYLETIPIIIDWMALALIGVATVLCSMLAAWFPARRAGQMKVQALLQKF